MVHPEARDLAFSDETEDQLVTRREDLGRSMRMAARSLMSKKRRCCLVPGYPPVGQPVGLLSASVEVVEAGQLPRHSIEQADVVLDELADLATP
jgi:hypothetical protein